MTNWAQAYFDMWGKPPGVPLTPEEFAERETLWNARVLAKIEETEGYAMDTVDHGLTDSILKDPEKAIC